jgi:gas vesicle protein
VERGLHCCYLKEILSMVTRDMLLGLGIGAALAFIADPQTGRRRRALIRDRVVRASRKTRDALDATARDVANRTSGIVASARGRWSETSVDDRRLLERVRAKLGRASSHPRAIDVEVTDATVTLLGPVLKSEVDDVIDAIAAVRGVRNVVNEMDVHESAEGIPALQGERSVAGPSLDILQRNWSPATQALVTAAGLAATAACLAVYARR